MLLWLSLYHPPIRLWNRSWKCPLKMNIYKSYNPAFPLIQVFLFPHIFTPTIKLLFSYSFESISFYSPFVPTWKILSAFLIANLQQKTGFAFVLIWECLNFWFSTFWRTVFLDILDKDSYIDCFFVCLFCLFSSSTLNMSPLHYGLAEFPLRSQTFFWGSFVYENFAAFKTLSLSSNSLILVCLCAYLFVLRNHGTFLDV